MKVVAGDYKNITMMFGILECNNGFFSTQRYQKDDVTMIEEVTESNLKSMKAKLGWGIGLGLATGGIGALVGLLAMGNKRQIMAVSFKDGKSICVECKPREVAKLKMLMHGKSNK